MLPKNSGKCHPSSSIYTSSWRCTHDTSLEDPCQACQEEFTAPHTALAEKSPLLHILIETRARSAARGVTLHVRRHLDIDHLRGGCVIWNLRKRMRREPSPSHPEPEPMSTCLGNVPAARCGKTVGTGDEAYAAPRASWPSEYFDFLAGRAP